MEPQKEYFQIKAGLWKEYEIATHNSRNRTRGSYTRNRRGTIEQIVKTDRAQSTNQVDQGKRPASKGVIEAIAKHPQEKHVANKMKDALAKEHGRECSQEVRVGGC